MTGFYARPPVGARPVARSISPSRAKNGSSAPDGAIPGRCRSVHRRPDGGAAGRQERGRGQGAAGAARVVRTARVRRPEGGRGDSGVPVVSGRGDRGALGDGAAAVADGEVLAQLGGAGGEVVAPLGVGVGGGAVDDDRAGVGVLGEAVARVAPGGRVVDDMRDDLAVPAELVAVAVALEGGVAPAVDAVAEGPGVLDGDGRGEGPQVDTVVRIVVQTGSGDEVAGAGAELDGDAVRVLAVGGGVVVAVTVQVLHGVVHRSVAGEREAGVAAVDGLDVVPVGAGAGLADDRAVRGVLEGDVRDVPVVGGELEDPGAG